MRIGIFTDTYIPDINGVVTSIVTLKEELEKNGHSVYIVTNQAHSLITKMDNDVVRIPGIRIKKLYNYVAAPVYSRAAFKLIKRLDLDIIHTHTEFGIGLFGRIVAKRLGIPSVYTYHTMYEDYLHYMGPLQTPGKKVVKRLSRVYGNKCTKLVVPSTKTINALKKYGVQNDYYVVPTGININYFTHQISLDVLDNLRSSLNITYSNFVILSVGRLAKEKSFDEVIEGFKQIYKLNNEARLIIVGDGPSYDELFALTIGYEDVIHFTGKVPFDSVSQYYQIADLYVSCATTETQGLTYIEAMASKLPVIAKYDDNLVDLINGKNGVLINDISDFVNNVILLIDGEEEYYKNMSNTAYETALSFDSHAFYEHIISVYGDAINDYNKQ